MKDRKKDKTGKVSYIFTRETLGMTLMLFCALVFVMLLTREHVFSSMGEAICTFMYGTFGYGSYIIVALLAYLSEWLVFEKKLKLNKKIVLTVSLSIVMLFLLIHSITSSGISLSNYGGYLSDCYTNAAQGWGGYTFGGVICGLIVYPVAFLTTFIGAYVVFSVLLAGSLYLVFMTAKRNLPASEKKEAVAAGAQADYKEPVQETVTTQPDHVYSVVDHEIVDTVSFSPERHAQDAQPEQPTEETGRSAQEDARQILLRRDGSAAESYRRNLIFSEDSYFNHSHSTDEDYYSSFGGSPQEQPQQAQPQQAQPQTYSDMYQSGVIEEPAGQPPVSSVSEQTAQSYSAAEDYPAEMHEDGIEVVPPRTYGEEEQQVQDEYPAEVQPPVDDSRGDIVRESYVERLSDTDGEDVRRDPAEPENSSENTEETGRDGFARPRGDDRQDILPRDERESGRESRASDLFSDDENDGENGDDVYPDLGERLGGRDRLDGDSSLRRVDDRRGETAGDRSSEIGGRSVDRASDRTPDRASDNPLGRRDLTGEGRITGDRSTTDRPTGDVRPIRGVAPIGSQKPEPQEEKPEEKPVHVWKKYVRPPLDLLDDYPEVNNVNTAEIEDSKNIIIDTLKRFNIDCEIANVTIGPAITRYDVTILDRANIKRSLSYKDEIAISLMKDNVNTYLNFSKGALSIEVPNRNRAIVGLKGLLASPKFINSKPNSIVFGLGKNVDGEVVCPDITKMPHLLVAGTTGSGKSICLSALLISLLYKYGPDELRLILVDPKQVEFIPYDKLPHLMINEIIFDVTKALKALDWAVKEMERRYTLFKEMSETSVTTKNLEEYNAHLQEGEQKLPKIVIILDEFGDLMMQAKKDIQSKIILLAQKARACGIHLILATQRPSVDCITGLIKSNLPTRIGFKVNSFDDSRTIFDKGGAEKLLGKGDLYFRSADQPDLARIQGCFVDSHEVQKVTDFVKQHNETYFDPDASSFINKKDDEVPSDSNGGDLGDDGDAKIDETFIKALKYCVVSNQASVSMLQRRFPVGYIKACKIIDWMAGMNYITQSEGSKPRKVLLSMEDFVNTYGEVDD